MPIIMLEDKISWGIPQLDLFENTCWDAPVSETRENVLSVLETNVLFNEEGFQFIYNSYQDNWFWIINVYYSVVYEWKKFNFNISLDVLKEQIFLSEIGIKPQDNEWSFQELLMNSDIDVQDIRNKIIEKKFPNRLIEEVITREWIQIEQIKSLLQERNKKNKSRKKLDYQKQLKIATEIAEKNNLWSIHHLKGEIYLWEDVFCIYQNWYIKDWKWIVYLFSQNTLFKIKLNYSITNANDIDYNEKVKVAKIENSEVWKKNFEAPSYHKVRWYDNKLMPIVFNVLNNSQFNPDVIWDE